MGRKARARKNYLLNHKKTEVMNEISKHEDIMQYELDAIKEMRAKLSKSEEERIRRIDLLRGTALGLTLGILGHLFVQFLYPIAEALLLGEYNPTFSGNLTICVISLILVVSVSVYLYRQLTKGENKLELSKKSEDVIEYAIRRRQQNLEKTKEESQHPNS
jgi:magnesium-transporting ATPase (P-type)